MAPRPSLCTLLVLNAIAAVAPAAEPDPWAGERAERRQRMEAMADAAARGELAGEELEQVNRYWATHLRRGEMNALESARYSAAELHLQQDAPEKAIAVLAKLLDGKVRPELAHLTRFNLAEVYRRRLQDVARAAEHYRQVGGPYRHRARHYMLQMLVEAGRPAEAAKAAADWVTEAKDKGEKLGLLHRLATLYKRAEMPEKALAVYERIAEEFAPDDIKAMQKARAQEVQDTFERIIQLRERDRWDPAERLERDLHRRARELMLANRWDEFRAFRAAMEDGFRKLERHEEEMERREREEEGELDEDEGPPRADF